MTFVGMTINEYGTEVSSHVCDTCGRPFTVCPPLPAPLDEEYGWQSCLAEDCESYDPLRDIDRVWDAVPSVRR